MTRDIAPRAECWYCGVLVSGNNLEMDHMPVPLHLGGEDTVPACRACHDMKDRFSFGSWPVGWVMRGIAGCETRESRIMLAKLCSLAWEHVKKDGK